MPRHSSAYAPDRPRSDARFSRAARASLWWIVGGESDDAALMSAIATRADKEAFARLFRLYAPKVKAHLVARGARPGIADELTQEVMLVVWRKAASFDASKGSLVTWLYTISRNCLLNQLRHGGRHGGELDLSNPEAEPPPSSEQQLMDVEQRRSVGRVVERLPTEQREVLLGAYWRGQTLQQYAEERAIPLGTVKTRVRLALARLRDLLSVRSDP